jgi:hypothetical protein
MQNVSVFATSIAQLKPPQNKIPPIPPAISNVASEKRELGRQRNAQTRAISPLRGSGLFGSLIMSPDDGFHQQLQESSPEPKPLPIDPLFVLMNIKTVLAPSALSPIKQPYVV